jgi:hypothetical protein
VDAVTTFSGTRTQQEDAMDYEDRGTVAVEARTAKVPSLAFLGIAVGAMALSATLVLTGRKQLGNFIGQWAPSILIMGLYNKIAKEIAVPKRQGTNAGTGRGLGMGTGVGSSLGGAPAGA